MIKHKTNKGYGATINTCYNTPRKRNADVMRFLDHITAFAGSVRTSDSQSGFRVYSLER